MRNKLDELLTELDWSQRKLARYCEVEPNTIGRWYRGEVQTPVIVIKHLQLLAYISGVLNEGA